MVGLLIAMATVFVVAVGAAMWMANVVTYVGPVDEWVCVDGEAPAVLVEGDRACYREGSELPAGAEWDPFGEPAA